MSLKHFFSPVAIAVVGASRNPKKVGRQILDNIILSGYQGDIYAVNLKDKSVASLPTFSDLNNIPVKNFAELMVIMAIPAPLVLKEVEKCGQLGVKNIVIISAGFKELDKAGKARETELKMLIEKYQLNVLGPNCLGFINNFYRFNASFSHRANINSSIALISQSGAIGSSILDWLKEQNLGLGYFISLGNKAGLNENHFLEYLSKDKNITAIVLYLEEIENGEEFMSIVSKISAKKLVIVLKAGVSKRGQAIAKSHTGALTGEAAIIKAGLERSGAILIDNLTDLFNIIILLRRALALKNKLNNKLQIITNAGGLAVLSADATTKYQLDLINSLDLLGNASFEDYESALQKRLAQDKEASTLILLSPQLATQPLLVAQAISRLASKNSKRLIMTCFLGGKTVLEAKDNLIANGVPVFSFPEQAIKSLANLVNQLGRLNQLTPFNLSKKESAISQVETDYDYLELLNLLNKYKINQVRTEKLYFNLIKNNLDEKVMRPKKITEPNLAELKNITFPLVLKAVGPDFIHKSDKGGVILGINSLADLKKASEELIAHHKLSFDQQKNYLVIQPQIKEKLELIVGFKRDASFGPVLLVGLGGIYAEIFKEVKLTIADLDEKRALEFIRNLPFFPILEGARGGVKYNLDQLVKVLVNLSKLANQEKHLKELDINPLFLTAKDILAGDVRAF